MAEKWKLEIQGMTCSSCATHVSKKLKTFTSFKDGVVVDWKAGTASLSTDEPIDQEQIGNSISSAGYKMISMKPEDFNERKKDFDLIVIGGGSAGFAAAIQAVEMNKTAMMIEQGTMGGTCVNVGCVPSKFLIHRSGLSDPGDWNTDMAGLVSRMRTKKYEEVLASYGDTITYLKGKATIVNSNTIKLEDGRTKTGKVILIATGSRPVFPDIPGAESTEILDSEALLNLSSAPESLVILGGRFIALELGQAFSRLGSKVTILQRSDRLIPDDESEISESIRESLENEGIEVITGVTLQSVESQGGDKTVRFSHEGTSLQRTGTVVLSALGRRGNTDMLNLQSLGVELDSRGRIVTDSAMRATGTEFFAAGDVVSSPALVYVAAKEGKTAARNALGVNLENDGFRTVPEVIFTSPQVARVGLTVREAEENGYSAEKSSFPLSETPYAAVNEVTKGIVILVRDIDSHKLLGGHIVAPNAGDMIQTLTVAIEAGWTTDRLQDVLFPYLTGVEALKLSAIAFSKDVAKLSCCAA
jgi:mercuric reductase